MEQGKYLQIDHLLENQSLSAYQRIYKIHHRTNIRKWFLGIFILSILFLFLPWTQNIKAKGKVTALSPSDRPQEVHSIISGSIIQWRKKEGDYVQKGDTILILGEVKSEYLDPQLLDNTKIQLESKKSSATSYYQKAEMANLQNEALVRARNLKLQSLDNKLLQQALKIRNDSSELVAIEIELKTYQRQAEAARKMYENGAISLTDYEKRTVSYQNGLAKKNITQNKWLQSKQELAQLYIEKNATIQDYADKIAKAQGERYGSISNAASYDAEAAKLQNQYNNYQVRQGLYVVKAPQSGQLVHAHKAGIGEIVKESEKIIEIVPLQQSKAIEIFIEPVDLPLIQVGQNVRFVFDGYPAIVFSGWPEHSFGIFGGKVAFIENSIHPSGKFRVLVSEDSQYKPWPENLKMGNGANAIALLNNVFVGYEIWRNINGFPPDFYHASSAEKKEKK